MSALVFLAYISLLSLGIIDNIRGPFFPEIVSDLQLSGSTGSLFFAVTSLVAFLGSWSCQFILRKRDSLFVVWLASFIFAIGFMAVAAATELTWLLASCALFGWALGALNVGQNLMVVEGSSPDLRRRLLNGLHSMYAFAALITPILATGFRWLGLSWRQTFFAVALLPLLSGIWAFSWRKRKHAHSEEQQQNPLSDREWWTCVAFAVVLSGYLWGELSVTTRLVSWLRNDLQFSPDKANLYQSLFFLGLLVGRMSLSFVHLPGLSNWQVLRWSAGLSAVLYLAGLIWSPEVLLISGFTMAPFFPVAMDQIKELLGPKSHQGIGFVIAFSSLSLVLMHVVIGAMTDWVGLTAALKVCAFAQLAASSGVLWMKRKMS